MSAGGKSISSEGTKIAAHYLQSLILHGMVISIDPAQRDRGYPPQSLVTRRKDVDLLCLITQNWSAGRNTRNMKDCMCVEFFTLVKKLFEHASSLWVIFPDLSASFLENKPSLLPGTFA